MFDPKISVSNTRHEINLYPLSTEGKVFCKKYTDGLVDENGICFRLPPSKTAIQVEYKIPTHLKRDQYKAAYELHEDLAEFIKNAYSNQFSYLSKITEYLTPQIGKQITVKNRFNKDKKVKLFSVSKPLVYFGFGNPGLPGSTFVEIVVSA